MNNFIKKNQIKNIEFVNADIFDDVLKDDFFISNKLLGLGKKFLIEGFKKEFTSSFFIFLIHKSFDVISSKEKFSLI